MMWWGCGPGAWGGSWWWAGGLMMLLFWVLLIGAAVWLVRSLLAGSSSQGAERSRALAILEERFARGEITAEELRRMREELQRR